jgi:hypothetical protein
MTCKSYCKNFPLSSNFALEEINLLHKDWQKKRTNFSQRELLTRNHFHQHFTSSFFERKFLNSFFALWQKEIGAKAACKMLLELLTRNHFELFN